MNATRGFASEVNRALRSLTRKFQERGVGPRPADPVGVAVTATEGQRDSLPTPSGSIALGRHASIPGLRPRLLISSALREAHGIGPRGRRSAPPTARARAGSAAIFRRWASSPSGQNQSGGLKIRTTVQVGRAVNGSWRGLSRFDLAATVNDESVGAPLRHSSANRHARARRYVRIGQTPGKDPNSLAVSELDAEQAIRPRRALDDTGPRHLVIPVAVERVGSLRMRPEPLLELTGRQTPRREGNLFTRPSRRYSRCGRHRPADPVRLAGRRRTEGRSRLDDRRPREIGIPPDRSKQRGHDNSADGHPPGPARRLDLRRRLEARTWSAGPPRRGRGPLSCLTWLCRALRSRHENLSRIVAHVAADCELGAEGGAPALAIGAGATQTSRRDGSLRCGAGWLGGPG